MYLKRFEEIFGCGKDIRTYFAPGRVNLIGEHTDYNGGHVFPCALQLGVYMVARPRADKMLRFYSDNFPQTGLVEVPLDDISNKASQGWANYVLGVISTMIGKNLPLKTGVDCYVYGDIPSGAGLSSSAAVEVATGIMLKDMFNLENLSLLDIALISQLSENTFIGVNCGIMDQYTSAFGKAGHALFLDTNALRHQYAPLIQDNYKIVITNSNVKHKLVASKYNERRAECTEALKCLQKVKNIKTLGDLSKEEFDDIKDCIKDKKALKRARHAVYENQRTIKAFECLTGGDMTTFGELMNQSHISLRDDFEVSCPEMDLLAETAWMQKGVAGSRITGGGFGGCTVSIVSSENVEEFTTSMGSVYTSKSGNKADFYVVNAGNGARRLFIT